MTRWEKAAWLFTLAAIAAIVFVGVTLVKASNGDYTLTVDGTEYAPHYVVGNGPTVHYYTPGTMPSVAHTERHTWTGNGFGNLPCEGTIHWVDNANVLTISHCEQEPGTTTTTIPRTTTTIWPSTTTTTQAIVTTTTTQPGTTTTRPDGTTTTTTPTTSTTVVGSTTTTTQVGASTTTTVTLCGKGGDAPCGGVATGGGFSALTPVAPGPITTNNGSGTAWGWLIAGALLFLLGLVTLVGGATHAYLKGLRDD